MWRRLMSLVRTRAALIAERDRALDQALESNNARLAMAEQLVGLRVDNIGLQARLDAREVLLRERERKIKRLQDYRIGIVAVQGQGVLQ